MTPPFPTTDFESIQGGSWTQFDGPETIFKSNFRIKPLSLSTFQNYWLIDEEKGLWGYMIYDRSRRAWHTIRTSGTIIELNHPDEILIASQNSAMIYNLQDQSSTPVPPVPYKSGRNASAIRLHNQDILFVGGVDTNESERFESRAAGAIFRVKSRTWESIPSLHKRQNSPITLLQNGHVLVSVSTSGHDTGGDDIFDPERGEWIASIPREVRYSSNTEYIHCSNGAVLRFGHHRERSGSSKWYRLCLLKANTTQWIELMSSEFWSESWGGRFVRLQDQGWLAQFLHHEENTSCKGPRACSCWTLVGFENGQVKCKHIPAFDSVSRIHSIFQLGERGICLYSRNEKVFQLYEW